MFAAFGRVFWGLLLAILDVKLEGIDVLPDVLGYVLVAVGCAGLARASRYFGSAGRVSWLLAALALAGFVVRGPLFSFLCVLADGAMMWLVLTGVMDYATARDRPDLAARAGSHRLAYAMLMGLAALTGLIASTQGDVATVLALVWIACTLPLLYLILRLILSARDELVAVSAA